MSTMQAPVTEVAFCPLYQLLVSERQSLDSVVSRLASGQTPQYEPLNGRSRAAGMIQHSICHRRAQGGQPRAGALALIEEVIDHLPENERSDILESLAACQIGCALIR